MRLISCELSSIVGLGTVAIEAGCEVGKLRKFLVGKGVKPSTCSRNRSRLLYDSVDIIRVFKDIRKPLTSLENGV